MTNENPGQMVIANVFMFVNSFDKKEGRHNSVILEKIVQFQNQKSWKINLLRLQMKHVILKICNILTSDTKFYPHHFNIIRVTGCNSLRRKD